MMFPDQTDFSPQFLAQTSNFLGASPSECLQFELNSG